MAINAYNLGGSAARPATAPDWARDKYGNVTMLPASYYATADNAAVNVARQGTGLMPADKGYGITSHGQTLRTSADQTLGRGRKDRPAIPTGGSGLDSLSLAAIKRDKGDVLLVCSADLLATTLKRLSMFVMRAKAKLRDAGADFAIYGLLGQSTASLGDQANAPWSAANMGEASVVQLYPAQGVARQLWLSPASAPAPAGPTLALADWQCSEVLSGIATVSAAVAEAFVPQMLNFESVGGVSFKKGCYPGQEVVARSQFRGTLKRRAYIAQWADGVAQAQAFDAAGSEGPLAPPVAAGQELFASQDPEQPCGLVVQAARSAQGPWLAIVSMQTSAAEAGELHLGSPSGPALTLLPLPYALLEDI